MLWLLLLSLIKKLGKIPKVNFSLEKTIKKLRTKSNHKVLSYDWFKIQPKFNQLLSFISISDHSIGQSTFSGVTLEDQGCIRDFHFFFWPIFFKPILIQFFELIPTYQISFDFEHVVLSYEIFGFFLTNVH